MTTFKASVQYGDFSGTAAADNADRDYGLWNYLEDKGLIKENEFLIATRLWVGENLSGKQGQVTVKAYVFDCSKPEHDNVKAAIDGMDDPIPVREVNVELTLEEFVCLFKRFSVTLTRPSLNIDNREYKLVE